MTQFQSSSLCRWYLKQKILSQLHLTHSASIEFLRQFWLSYLGRRNSNANRQELEALAQSLRRTLERVKAVRVFAVKEGGEGMGRRVQEVLKSVSASVRRALELWERDG